MTVRISELNELSVDLSQSDLLPVVDVSAAETKKIQISSLLQVGISGAPSGFIDLSRLNQSSVAKLGATALAETGVASGVYGDASTVAQFVVNAQGLITTATGVPIVTTASSITGLAPVATSGTYASLSGLPTLGTLSSQDANSVAISGGTISGVTFISGSVTISGGTISGITDLAIEDGGTGASTASGARTNLGLAIGSDVQAYSSVLSGVAAQFTAADELIYASASGVVASAPLSSTGRSIVAASGVADARTTLGLASMALQDAGSVAISGGTISGITDLAIADGGTGASDASTARTNLGLAIGTDIQAYDAGLSSIAGLTTAADQLLYLTGADTYSTSSLPSYARNFLASGDSASSARTVLGLGTLSTKSIVSSGDIAASVVSGVNIAANSLTFDNYANDSVVEAAIASSAVTTSKIADSGVTASKLADNSSTIVAVGAPITNGAFIGQQYQDSVTDYVYVWDGDSWERQAALASIAFTDSTPIVFDVAYPDAYSATITTSLENQTANTFFAGPTSGNTTTPSFRSIVPADLPVATSGTVGAVLPGAGLSVGGAGVLNHSNATTAGTYTGAVTIDAQGHIVSAQASLQSSDIPDLDASKIVTGTFGSAFLAPGSVTASQLADYGIAQISTTAPTPEFAGQWWVNPTDRSAYIWVGDVEPNIQGYWLNLGYGSPTQLNIRFGGTYNASGNTIESLNSFGAEAGLIVGSGLATPNTANNGVYLIVTASGTGITPAPATSLAVGNWILSEGVGSNWKKVDLGIVGETVSDNDVLVNGAVLSPVASGIATQEDFNEEAWSRLQIATTLTAGIVKASSTIAVASGTGVMSVVEIDEGTY